MLPAKEFLFSTPTEFFHLDKIHKAGVEGNIHI